MKYLLYIAAVSLCVACGTRKSEVSIQEGNTDTKLDLTAAADKEINTAAGSAIFINKDKAIVTETHGQSGVYTPINPDKPMTVIDPEGRKTEVYNGKWETGRQSSRTQSEEKEVIKHTDTFSGNETSKTKTDLKAESATNNKVKTKSTDRDFDIITPCLYLAGLCIMFWFFVIKKRSNEED